MTYIDLFAGAGGLSEGFLRQGFVPVAHVEMDKDACLTLRTRLVFHHLKKSGNEKIYFDYLKGRISRDQLHTFLPITEFNSVINEKITESTFESVSCAILRLASRKRIDLIIGGPPCQAYSNVGRAALKHKYFDERKLLYKLYGRFLIRFKPKMFVFENVPGLYTCDEGKYYKNLKKYFGRIGYVLEDKLLNAADFDVIQKRERIILIGWRKDISFHYPKFKKSASMWTVKDILQDLPRLKAGESLPKTKYKQKSNEYLSQTGIRNGASFVTQHVTRTHNLNDLRIYKMAIEKIERVGTRLRNDQIPSRLRTQKNTTSFLDRFKVIKAYDLSHTIIAHIAKDGHYYIHPDKKQLRSISVREAARIQSFPDDYFFEGSRSAAFKQIGNAVPPLMAEAVAAKIKKFFKPKR